MGRDIPYRHVPGTSFLPDAAVPSFDVSPSDDCFTYTAGMQSFMERDAADSGPSSMDESLMLYAQAVRATQVIFERGAHEAPGVDIGLMERIVDALAAGQTELMSPVVEVTRSVYCPARQGVNTALYALRIAEGLGYSRPERLRLAMAASVHDAGMREYHALASANRSLSPDEMMELRLHTIRGARILTDAGGLPPEAPIVALQHHERMDGCGYPKALRGDDIHEFSRIVGLCSAYVAMISSRPYRRRLSASEAFRVLMAGKNGFEYSLLKLLLERVGLYPIGCQVELSSGEQARVIAPNPSIPQRPVVRIVADRNGDVIVGGRVCDLAGDPLVHIVRQTI